MEGDNILFQLAAKYTNSFSEIKRTFKTSFRNVFTTIRKLLADYIYLQFNRKDKTHPPRLFLCRLRKPFLLLKEIFCDV